MVYVSGHDFVGNQSAITYGHNYLLLLPINSSGTAGRLQQTAGTKCLSDICPSIRMERRGVLKGGTGMLP